MVYSVVLKFNSRYNFIVGINRKGTAEVDGKEIRVLDKAEVIFQCWLCIFTEYI